MGMSFTTQVHLEGMNRRLSDAKLDSAQKQLVESVGQDSNHYVPVDTGALHDNMEYGANFTEVIWPANYAKAVYNADSVHPAPNRLGTDPHTQWFEYAKSKHVREWADVVKDALR
jgi:hypothetical protein